jgi:serine/threonine protein kinase
MITIDTPSKTKKQEIEKTAFLGPNGLLTSPQAAAVESSPLPKELLEFLEPPTLKDSVGRLGHYHIESVIGRGGFGVVLKAFDEKLQRHVAIKVLDPELGLTSPVRKRFLREARSAAKVRHENIIQIYAVEESRLPYLVMEYIDGETLLERLTDQGPLDATEVVRLGRQIAEGLAAAHHQGLIHRDIKPANILLEKGTVDRVKITDFGLARMADDASHSQSGAIVGTPMYMSPEQSNGDTIDHRTDLFSLGSVLYVMASGRPPFRASTTMGVMKRVVHETPRAIREIVPDVPEGLCGIINRLHKKNPHERFSSAQDVVAALSRCLEDPKAIAATPLAKSPPQTRFVLLIGAVFSLMSLAVALTSWYGRGTPPPTTSARVSESPIATDPDAAWASELAGKSAGFQSLMVGKKLKERNPNFRPEQSMRPRIIDGKLVGLILDTSTLGDLSPLRALTDLADLELIPTGPSDLSDLSGLKGLKLNRLIAANNPIADLTPLEGMPLTELVIWGHNVHDLTPLKGMPLKRITCGGGPVSDLSPLEGAPLNFVCTSWSDVKTLAPLRGCSNLELLMIEHTKITDLTPIEEIKLKELYMLGSPLQDFNPISRMPIRGLSLNYDPQRDRDWLTSMPELISINGKPKDEILKPLAGKNSP